MPLPIATLVVRCAEVYALAGVGFSLFFATFGVQRIDPLARGAGWGFRFLILPGSVLFWPLLLLRWVKGSTAPPVETNAHRRRAGRPS
jgi:hypothetical protein